MIWRNSPECTPERADRPAGSTLPHGFTLIEMTVVLVVVGLVLSLVLAHGPMRSRTLEARIAARDITHTLRAARAMAIVANRPVEFILDLGRHNFRLDAGAANGLPSWLSLSAVAVPGETFGNRIVGIRFAADGSASGGRIELADGELRLSIDVDWLTGRVTLADVR